MAKVGTVPGTLDPDSDLMERVYRLRAARLAERHEGNAQSTTVPALAFSLGNERYGIDLSHLVEVIPYKGCTSVPGAATALLGVINVRGHIRPCVDLRHLLGLPPADRDADGYVVMVRHDDGPVGLRVDRVDEVRQIDPAGLLGLGEQARSRFVKAVTKDAVILIDVSVALSALGLATS